MARLSDIFLEKERVQDVTAWMPIRKGVRFLVRPTAFQGYLNAVKGLESQKEDIREEGYATALAEHLIVDWEGLDNEEGEKLNCTIKKK